MASKLKQPTFETERLRLRPFRASDAKALHALYGDAANLRYWGTDPSPDLASTRRMLRWHISFHPFHYALWAIEEKKSRKLVGMINYHRRDMRDPQGQQAVGGARQAPGISPGGWPDPRPLAEGRTLA